MTLGSSHVQKARTVLNSRYCHKDFLTSSRWSKADIKQKFESAMAIFKVRDHRTYAQDDNGHKSDTGRVTAHQTPPGDQTALKQLVVNTDSNTSKVKESIVHINKHKYQNVGHNYMASQDKAANCKVNFDCVRKQLRPSSTQVSECYPIPTSNRCQLLDNDHEVQVNTTTEVDFQTVDSYVCEQLQTDPGIQQNIVQPDPKRTVADPFVIPEYQKCKDQIGTKFGCVPLAPIYVYKGPTTYWHAIPDILTAHKLIRQSGLPNFLGLRIPVRTNLNVNSWRHHLVDYFDQQLPDLIEFGFPLDFDRSRDLQITFVNHASARLYPDHVDKYIEEEVGFQAMLGPLDSKPFDIHISPFMTRAKSDSESRRTIMDLCFPKGLSINDGVLKDTYLGTNFQMHYPSIDSIIRKLNKLGPSAQIFKVDISRAFRHIRIDPGDIDLLGLQHRDKLYLDLSLPFGYRLGAFFFSKISDAVRYIMNKNGHNALMNYIDDLIYCGLPSNIGHSYQFLLNLLQDLGLDISTKKLCPPATNVISQWAKLHHFDIKMTTGPMSINCLFLIWFESSNDIIFTTSK